MSEGGDSSHEPPQSVAMRTFQPRTAHQCRLDEVVRQHVAAEGLASLELRQAAALGERGCTRMMALCPQ